MANATVGIFMPCHNYGAYIHEALDSLFKQTFQDFELIIADDASTDETTKKILQEISLPHGQIFFEEKNQGLNRMRNKYMAMFNTEFVLSFDPDDILEPTFLEKSVAYLKLHPKKAAVAVWLQLFGTREGIVKFDEQQARLPEMLITNNYLGSCLMRKSVFDEIGGYDREREVNGAEDYDFWLTVLERGWELGVIPEVLFRYRRTKDALSAKSAMPGMSLIWRKKIIERHIGSYQKYLVDTLLGYEARASGSHAGYVETKDQYDELHNYVEKDLIPELERQRKYIAKLEKTSLAYYRLRIKGKVRHTIKKRKR